MKILPWLLSLFLLSLASPAQLKLPKTGLSQANSSFHANLEVIVLAFQTNYHSIQGEPLPSESEKAVFKSTRTVPGTLHALIYRFPSVVDSSASWQAIMYHGENHQAAIKSYKSLCKQIKNANISGIGQFRGEYEEPNPDLRFAASSFKMNSSDKRYYQYYAEVDLTLNAEEQWEVHLNLLRKKNDEDLY